MKISMSRFGNSLCTRSSGRAAYSLIDDAFEASGDDRILFDFSGVFSVTNSFADECFGRIASERGMDFMRKRTSFGEIDRTNALLIRMAMERRAKQKELANV